VTASVQWSSDTPAIATISNSVGSQGSATSVASGSAVISASLGSIQGSTTLVVTPAALVSIAVNPTNPSIALGTKQPFAAVGTFADSSTQDLTASATWSSDTPSTASVNSTGVATGLGQGTAMISATVGTVSGSSTLTVTPAALVSILVNPSAATAPVGTTQAFTATGTYTDGSTQDVTQSGHWSSSNGASATVSNTPGSQGVANALTTGMTAITVSLNGVNGTAALTVSPAALVSLALSPQNPTITLGMSQGFTATGTYTDSSTQDVTTVVQWNSSPVSVAVINNVGLATSAAPGAATISATMGTISAQTTLNVGQPSCLNFYPVDIFLNLNGMPPGTPVTTASLSAGTELAANYEGWASASPAQTFSASQVALPAGIAVNNGSTHTCTYTTQSLAHSGSGSFTVSTLNLENKTPTQLVISGWIVNTPPNQGTRGYLYDLAQTVGNRSFAATVQIDSGTNQTQACSSYGIEIESSGGQTTHSPCNLAVSPGGTYFVQMHVNYTSSGSCNFGAVNAPCAELNVYNTSGSSFTQVGNTVAVALGGIDTTAGFSLGNNEQGTFNGTIYFQNWMIDYTNHQFPNLPH
jgi:trimeric autotransporter adhesin